KNNLKQIGLAWITHHSAQGHFPTGGWGYFWTGDPDYGFGKGQPGGWAYNTLPYLEERNVDDLGRGLNYSAGQKQTALGTMVSSPVKGFSCPSRRSEFTLFPCPQCQSDSGNYRNFTYSGKQVSRGDYCANVGDDAKLASPNGIEDAAPNKLAKG